MSDIDILAQIQDVDLATVETAYPVLMAGVVQASITDFELKSVEGKDGSSPWAIISYSLITPWKTQPIDGNPSRDVMPGFKFTERIYLKPWTDDKTGETKNLGVTRLALLREAIFGKAKPGTKLIPSDFINQLVTVKLKFDPAPKNKKTGEIYGPQTYVDGYIRTAGR